MSKIRIGIVGYGNIGRGVEKAVQAAPDMEMTAVFTRRDPSEVKICDGSAAVMHVGRAADMKGSVDVMVLCGGSASDLPVQGPQFAKDFNIVDSFDTHAKIPEYMAAVDAAAKGTTAIISAGWDPGLFSMMRAMSDAVLPDGSDYTFYGRGVSQGHSDAIRRIKDVKNAIQYTVPIGGAVDAARSGARPKLSARQRMTRECYVVAREGADLARIEREIKTMPNYFADYDTTVTFITERELTENHSKMPHGGLMLRSGGTGQSRHVMEFSLALDSNPEFTGSVLVAYARAAFRMSREGNHGAKTVLDVPLTYLSAKDRGTLIKELL